MSNSRLFESLRVSGYRYAPESYRYDIKVNGKWYHANLSCGEKSDMSTEYLMYGSKAVLDKIKQLYRKRIKQPTSWMTYGVVDKSNDKKFYYIDNQTVGFCDNTDLKTRQYVHNIAIKNIVETTKNSTAILDGNFKITDVKEERLDTSKQIIVYLNRNNSFTDMFTKT
jgi:hypothetical protein